jgi:hypothetical protein
MTEEEVRVVVVVVVVLVVEVEVCGRIRRTRERMSTRYDRRKNWLEDTRGEDNGAGLVKHQSSVSKYNRLVMPAGRAMEGEGGVKGGEGLEGAMDGQKIGLLYSSLNTCEGDYSIAMRPLTISGASRDFRCLVERLLVPIAKGLFFLVPSKKISREKIFLVPPSIARC